MTKKANSLQPRNAIKTILDDVTAFAFCLHFQPYPYQQAFLEDEHQKIVWVCGRQVGKTTCAAIKSVWQAIRAPNQIILIVSPTQRQSGIMFWRVRELTNQRELIRNLLTRETLTALYFKNGSEIHSLPAGRTGETIRGYKANHIYVDEAAYVPSKAFTAIKPSLATTYGSHGTLTFLGTPFGMNGDFWEAWNSPTFTKHHAVSADNPLITPEYLVDAAKHTSDAEYRQEYLGDFLSNANNFLPRTLINACTYDPECLEEPLNLVNAEFPRANKDYYLGVDVARFGLDETVYTVAEYDGARYIIVEIQATSQKPMTDVMGRVKALNQKYKGFKRIYVDESGMGGGVLDEVRETLPETQGVAFTLENKEALYKNLERLMEKGLLYYPQNKRLIAQLAALEKGYTSNGHLKVGHPDTPNAHDDLTDSLALAVYAHAYEGKAYVLPALPKW